MEIFISNLKIESRKIIVCLFDLSNIMLIFVAVKEIGDGESPIFVFRI